MKTEGLPNLLTFCRILLSLGLFFLPFPGAPFVLLYLLCGLTDVLDGHLARKLKAETELGSRLDSLADLFLCALILYTVIRTTRAAVPVLAGIGAILVIRTGNALFCKIKFGRAAGIHTLANKLTGLLFFFCPLAGIFAGEIPLYVTGAAALLASAEEFLILLTSDVLDMNRQSIFKKS